MGSLGFEKKYKSLELICDTETRFICQISRKFPRSDKNKNTRFLNSICQILKSIFPRFKRSSAMLKIIL